MCNMTRLFVLLYLKNRGLNHLTRLSQNSLIVLCTLVALVASDGAILMSSKTLNKDIKVAAEGQPLTIEYSIFNIGEG